MDLNADLSHAKVNRLAEATKYSCNLLQLSFTRLDAI